nr:hypothetical protein Q903MT_gene2233 [Picea sitchensis]
MAASTFATSPASTDTPSPQLSLLGLSSTTIPLSFNHELASSSILCTFRNSSNLYSSLPSSAISFCSCSVRLFATLIWFFHHLSEIAALLRALSSLALLSRSPPHLVVSSSLHSATC